MSAKPILLVDDSAADVALAMAALSELKVGERRLEEQVAIAHDGEQALAFLQRTGAHAQRPEGHPAIVILDVKMPKMSGFEVLRAIRADPSIAKVPVVMLSTSADHRDVDRSYALGANGYVVKSLSFAEFTTRLLHLGRYWIDANEAPPGCLTLRS